MGDDPVNDAKPPMKSDALTKVALVVAVAATAAIGLFLASAGAFFCVGVLL